MFTLTPGQIQLLLLVLLLSAAGVLFASGVALVGAYRATRWVIREVERHLLAAPAARRGHPGLPLYDPVMAGTCVGGLGGLAYLTRKGTVCLSCALRDDPAYLIVPIALGCLVGACAGVAAWILAAQGADDGNPAPLVERPSAAPDCQRDGAGPVGRAVGASPSGPAPGARMRVR